MDAEAHRELNFLIKAFARFCSEADAIMLFENQFGKQPTRWQIANSNLGRFMGDKREYFKNNHRMRRFRAEREKYEASIGNNPMFSQAWRMEQYKWVYDRSIARSQETGNYSKPLDILTLAAKDAGGAYAPKTQNITVDNRVQTYNSNMSDEEINKRLARYLNQFGVSLPDMPLITKGGTVIESQADDVEIDDS